MTDFTLRMNRVPAPFRKTVTLAAVAACTPILTALFTGTGDLSGYTPNLGAGFVVRPTPVNLFLGNPGATGGIAAAVRNTSGSWQFHLDNGIEPELFALKWNDTPASANYRVSQTFLLPATGNIQVSCALVGRGYISTYDGNILNGIAARFDIDQTSVTDRNVGCFDDYQYDDVDPAPTSSPGYISVPLGAASSVTLAAEFDGNELRAYVDGNLIYTVAYADMTEFAGPGIVEWQHNFLDIGTPYTVVAIDEQSVCLLP